MAKNTKYDHFLCIESKGLIDITCVFQSFSDTNRETDRKQMHTRKGLLYSLKFYLKFLSIERNLINSVNLIQM